jgi:hypothetical protein
MVGLMIMKKYNFLKKLFKIIECSTVFQFNKLALSTFFHQNFKLKLKLFIFKLNESISKSALA